MITPAQRKLWWFAFGLGGILLLVLCVSLWQVFGQGITVWGNDATVVWALDIVSYDWWMGMACGALVFTGVSMLTESNASLTRLGVTIALFCAIAAAIYPIIHLGRPWYFYWNMPYPNRFGLWPQFRSPLFWDETDILGFLVTCPALWFATLLPDLAKIRDSSKGIQQKLYAVAALGWRFDATHWEAWRQVRSILAILGIVMGLTVQWGASVMYAASLEPGWHDTLLPFSTMVNAVFAGSALLLVIASLLQPRLRILDMNNLAWTILALGILSTYCYAATFFYSEAFGGSFERAAAARRATGPMGWSFWLVVILALLPVHLLWWRRIRTSPVVLCAIGMAVMAGLWADHFMNLVGSLQQDFLPGVSHGFGVTIWSVSTWLGSMSLFLLPVLLCIRFLPVSSLVEEECRP